MLTTIKRRLRIAAWIFLGLIVVIIAALAYGAVHIREWAVNKAESSTGRQITLANDIQAKWRWPTTIFYLNNLQIANFEQGTAPHMLSVDKAVVSINFAHLLRGHVRLPQVTLENPKLLLEKDAKGNANWDFISNAGGAAVLEMAKPDDRGDVPSIGRLMITKGTVEYKDPTRETDMKLVAETISGQAREHDKLQLNGNGTYQNQPFAMKMTGGSMFDLKQTDKPYPVDINVTVGKTNITLKGTMLDPIQFEGMDTALTIKGDDAAKLFDIFGTALPPTPPYDVTGQLVYDDGIWNFEGFKGRVGSSDLRGNVVWDRRDTDKKGGRPLLRESEENFRQLANATPQVVWAARPDGQLDYINDRCFQYSGERLVRNGLIDWGAIVHPDDLAHTTAIWLTSVQSGEPYNVEQRIYHKESDSYRWNLTLALPARNSMGQIVRWFGTNTDIDDQKRTEIILSEAREAAEAASVAKSEFLANMSHEIRTPMNAVIGMSHILARTEPLTPKQRDCVKTLQMSAAALLDLINDLLDIAKIESHSIELEKTHFDLALILNDVVSMMGVRAREKGLTLTADTEHFKDCGFIGDPARLRQILLNLCSNAVKFTDKGGVHISGECRKSTQPGMMDITIKVRDTGIGIAPDKLETIFQKFMQADSSINRKYGGTGLGLAITRTLIEIMGGTITVTSTVNAGSTFILNLTLPASDKVMFTPTDMPPLAEVYEKNTDSNGKQRILLVEDYAPNVLVTGTFLEEFGYEYDVASDGNEALAKIVSTPYMAVLM